MQDKTFSELTTSDLCVFLAFTAQNQEQGPMGISEGVTEKLQCSGTKKKMKARGERNRVIKKDKWSPRSAILDKKPDIIR